MFGMLGIKNYKPDFYDREQTLINANNRLLNSIRGENLKQLFWMWDKLDNEWVTDFPVVLIFETMQISAMNHKLDEIALGCNDIVMSEPLEPYWLDMDFDIEWREYNVSENGLILPKIVEEYRIIHDNGLSETALFGIGFCFSNGVLEITNGLDCNKIEFIGCQTVCNSIRVLSCT
jgi:hypothetical protein